MRYSPRSLIVATTLLALGLVIVMALYNRYTDDRHFVHIEPGMTPEEVIEVVGKPSHVKANGDWYYDLNSPGGPIGIMFDEEAKVFAVDWSPSYE